MKPVLTALCLDLATNAVGFCVGREGAYVRGFERSYGGSLYRRLDRIEQDVAQLAVEHLVTVIAVERPILYRGHKPDTFYILGQTVGMVGLWAHRHGLRFEEFYPSAVKAALGYGAADKEWMVAAAGTQTGAAVQGEHHADAIGVWFALWNKIAEERILQGRWANVSRETFAN